MCSNAESPWRCCPHCHSHGPGTAEVGWLPAGVPHPHAPDLVGPGHVYTCRRCRHAYRARPGAPASTGPDGRADPPADPTLRA